MEKCGEEREEQCKAEQEEEDREALQNQEKELRLEMQRMAKEGYQEKVSYRKVMVPQYSYPKFQRVL